MEELAGEMIASGATDPDARTERSRSKVQTLLFDVRVNMRNIATFARSLNYHTVNQNAIKET